MTSREVAVHDPILDRIRYMKNPAWDYIKNVPHDPLFASLDGGKKFNPAFYVDRGGWHEYPRDLVTKKWTWAIPDPEVLAFLLHALNGRPVVELGAGNGYWAWLLLQGGIDVNAYDQAPIGHEGSWFKRNEKTGEEPVIYYPVAEGSVEMLDLPENHDRVLLLCWPSYASEFAYEAVKAFHGDTVVYIGEGSGGCNASENFFKLMEGNCDCWLLDENDTHDCDPVEQEWGTEAFHGMVQWAGIHDNLVIYRRMP